MWKPPSPTETPRSPSTDETILGATTITRTKNPGRRFAQVVKLKKECVDEYKACHAAVWPEVAKQIKDCGIEDCKWVLLTWLHELSAALLSQLEALKHEDGAARIVV